MPRPCSAWVLPQPTTWQPALGSIHPPDISAPTSQGECWHTGPAPLLQQRTTKDPPALCPSAQGVQWGLPPTLLYKVVACSGAGGKISQTGSSQKLFPLPTVRVGWGNSGAPQGQARLLGTLQPVKERLGCDRHAAAPSQVQQRSRGPSSKEDSSEGKSPQLTLWNHKRALCCMWMRRPRKTAPPAGKKGTHRQRPRSQALSDRRSAGRTFARARQGGVCISLWAGRAKPQRRQRSSLPAGSQHGHTFQRPPFQGSEDPAPNHCTARRPGCKPGYSPQFPLAYKWRPHQVNHTLLEHNTKIRGGRRGPS